MTISTTTANPEKESEHRCLVCGAQYTESPGGDREYGHLDHCCHQSPEFHRGVGSPPGVADGIDDDALLVRADVAADFLDRGCPSCDRGDFKTVRGVRLHHARTHDRTIVDVSQCETCGDWFDNSRKDRDLTYCSTACASEAKYNLTTLTCDYCGDTFDLPEHKAADRKYCSRACHGAARSERRRAIKTCKCCGDEFEVRKSESHFVYCSSDCRKQDHYRTRQCAACGREYTKPVHRESTYCSRPCFNESKKSKPRPDDFEMFVWLLVCYEERTVEDTAARAHAVFGHDTYTADDVQACLADNGWESGQPAAGDDADVAACEVSHS